jgi:hypothetical protein
MQRRCLGPAVADRDAHLQVLRIDLGVLDEHVEVAVLVEDAGVDQLVVRRRAIAAPILLDEVAVRERRLRVLVEHPHERVRRRGVQVEVVLLDVLAVVALVAGQAEQALLEDRIAAVPQREGEAQLLATIGDAREPVFVPPVGACAGVVVGQIFPGGTMRAVVFADRSPRPIADVRAPALPMRLPQARFFEAAFFSGHRCLRQARTGLPGCRTAKRPRRRCNTP